MATRILIVDDTQFMRKMLADCLLQNGYEVAGEAGNGREAVRLYGELQPDLIFMDINMPEMSGVEAIQEILKLDPGAVILVCSAANHQEQIMEAMQAGAKGYVMKPFKTNRVLEIIRKYAEPHLVREETADSAPETVREEAADSAPETVREGDGETGSDEGPAPIAMAAEEVGAALAEMCPAAANLPETNPTAAENLPEIQVKSAPRQRGTPASSGSFGRRDRLKSFVSSLMCNWQEEMNGETASFTVVCTESENKVLVEMSSAGREKQTMQFTLDGLLQLSGWLEEHVDSNSLPVTSGA